MSYLSRCRYNLIILFLTFLIGTSCIGWKPNPQPAGDATTGPTTTSSPQTEGMESPMSRPCQDVLTANAQNIALTGTELWLTDISTEKAGLWSGFDDGIYSTIWGADWFALANYIPSPYALEDALNIQVSVGTNSWILVAPNDCFAQVETVHVKDSQTNKLVWEGAISNKFNNFPVSYTEINDKLKQSWDENGAALFIFAVYHKGKLYSVTPTKSTVVDNAPYLLTCEEAESNSNARTCLLHNGIDDSTETYSATVVPPPMPINSFANELYVHTIIKMPPENCPGSDTGDCPGVAHCNMDAHQCSVVLERFAPAYCSLIKDTCLVLACSTSGSSTKSWWYTAQCSQCSLCGF